MSLHAFAELGTFGIFGIFSIIKKDFLRFYQVDLAGSGLVKLDRCINK